jgi:CRP/FNR family transcriptional regulator, anaerobic regulatory protein
MLVSDPAHDASDAYSPCSTTPEQEISAGASVTCELCSLRGGCLPRHLNDTDLAAFSTLARLKRKVRGSARLFRAGDALTSVYVVRSGTFKTITLSHDGRPKITGFYLPGDLMGLEGIGDSTYAFDAIALENSEVCVLPLTQLESLAGIVPELLREFVRVLSVEITRDHRLTTLLGCMDAEQRVARFLLSLAERYHRLGYASKALLLHMTRDDIASYLGLSSETVSRILSRLRRRGVLTVDQRRIGFADSDRLSRAADW